MALVIASALTITYRHKCGDVVDMEWQLARLYGLNELPIRMFDELASA